jgi:hypothetical protein
MADARTIAFWEGAADLLALSNSKFNLQFAKSVIGPDGALTFNMVWQSKNLAPRTNISWTPVYGLNWTLEIPTSGISVTVGGIWQTCAIGQTFDISPVGLFTPSTVTGKPNFMNIGTNKYSYSGVNGIHIIVGVQNASGGFDPVSSHLNYNTFFNVKSANLI